MKNDLIRSWWWLIDHFKMPLFSRWWQQVPSLHHYEWEGGLTLPAQPDVKSKEEDPAWRKNMPWVLIRVLPRKSPDKSFLVYYDGDSHEGDWMCKADLKVDYIAMRAGPLSTAITALDRPGCTVGMEFMHSFETEYVILSEKEMKAYVKKHGFKTVFI